MSAPTDFAPAVKVSGVCSMFYWLWLTHWGCIGGIRNLHPQAALIMAIQLASKSDNRLCSKHKGSSSSCLPDPSSEFISSAAATAHALRRLEDGSFDQDQRPKPFLQSLFSSSTFLSLFGIHKDEDESTRGKERRTSHHHRRSACQKRNTAGHGECTDQPWGF